MIKFSTKSGNWEIKTPTIEKYYGIQEWLILSDQTDIKVRLISILSGAPEDELRDMDADKFNDVWDRTSDGPLSALTDTGFKKEVEIDGTKYGFINLSKLTVGELADMDTLKSHPQVSRQLHKMMAILYRPLNEDGTIKQYDDEGFDERAELFLKKMEISHVTTAIDFFFHITRISLNSMMDSLIPMIQEMLMNLTSQEMEDVTKRLQEDGVTLSTFLPETTYLKQTSALN